MEWFLNLPEGFPAVRTVPLTRKGQKPWFTQQTEVVCSLFVFLTKNP